MLSLLVNLSLRLTPTLIPSLGLKTYCLQFLAANTANSPSLRVACPICKTPYQIKARRGVGITSAGWREVFHWASTDQQFLCVRTSLHAKLPLII